MATASDKGTVIRVWSVPGAEKLYQFRRGTREARIYSINFNAVSTLLAVSSAHDTVHIFKLGSQEKGGKDGTGKLTSGKSASSSGSLVKPGSQAKGDKNGTGKLTGGKSVSPSGSRLSQEVKQRRMRTAQTSQQLINQRVHRDLLIAGKDLRALKEGMRRSLMERRRTGAFYFSLCAGGRVTEPESQGCLCVAARYI